MTTYRDLYNYWLDEVHGDMMPENAPYWMTGGKLPHELLEENDPVAYRWSFADWTDGLLDIGIDCDCGRPITDFDVCIDDDVECSVCSGEAFECEECGDVFPKSEHFSGEECDDCREAKEEDDE